MDSPGRRIVDLRDAITLAQRDLGRLAQELDSARTRLAGSVGALEIYGAAALAHGYYTHLERLLERIARDLNSAPFEGPDWHRRLLRSMTLERPGSRPAVLDVDLSDELDELLRFRHLFRDLYVLNLDAHRVREILDLAARLHPRVAAAFQRFDAFLEELVAAMR